VAAAFTTVRLHSFPQSTGNFRNTFETATLPVLARFSDKPDVSLRIPILAAALSAGLFAVFAGRAIAQAQTPTLTPSPVSVSFPWQQGTALPAMQLVSVKGGSSTAAYTVAVMPAGALWLSASPDSGNLPASLSLRVNPSGLPVGTYNASVQVSATGFATPATVTVTLVVTEPLPTLTVSSSSLSFTSPPNPPASQTFQLATTGGPVPFTAAAQGAAWVSLSPASGVALPGVPMVITVAVNPTGLDPSATPYTGKIVLTASGVPSANKTQNVNVSLLVNSITPAITSLWPAAALAGSGALTVTVRGTGFYKATTVSVTGSQTAIQTTFVSPSTLLAAIPASLVASAGTLGVVATNPPPGGASPSSPFIVSSTPVVQAVTNAASYTSAAASPGELATLFGSGIGPATPVGMNIVNGFAASTVSNVTVTIDGNPAALIYASQNQITVQVPYEVTLGLAKTVSVNNNAVIATGQVDTAATAPGIFTLDGSGTGQAAALTYSMKTGQYSVNGASNPVHVGDVLVLYLTGEGVYANSIVTPDGYIVPATLNPLPQMNPLPAVTIGGAAAAVQYAGPMVGGILGALQINAVVPAGATTGNAVPVSVAIGTAATQPGVTVVSK
jgi:uncharacterized protein (TIGR03437 family)